jgi:hypothetical protein
MLSKKSQHALVRIVALLLGASLFSSGLVLGPQTATANQNQPLDFAACVSAQGSGSVMVLMDESLTIYGFQGEPPSDPSNLRVAGAQLLIDDIQRVVDSSKVPVNVQLASFGDNFIVRSNGWVTVQPGNNSASSQLKSAVNSFSNPPTSNNGVETDFWTAIDGARKQFDSQNQCKLLVIFKDGIDFQNFFFGATSDYPIESIQTLLEEAKRKQDRNIAQQAAELAQADLCRAKGLADGLRGDGIFTISVGLGIGDFAELRDFTENQNKRCGELEGRGYLLRAEQPQDLIDLFARTLNPANQPTEFDGEFTFEMNEALSTISILTSGMLAGNQYFITPPSTCPGATRTVFDSSASSSSGSFGQGVTWTGAGYAQGEALRVFIKRAPLADNRCWNGTWTVDPGTQARSSLSIDADLQPSAVFSSANPAVRPGGILPAQILLRRISAPEEVGSRGLPGLTGEDLHPDLRVNLSGGLYSPSGSLVSSLFEGASLSSADLGETFDIAVPAGTPLGNYVLRLNLALEVAGIDIALSDVRTETVIEVGGQIPLPTVEGVVQFPGIQGSSPSKATVAFTNRADKPVTLNFDSATVVTTQAPENATDYKVVGESTSIEIPAGQTVEVELALSPDTSEEVKFAGQISGSIFVPVTASGENLDSSFQVEVPFKAEQFPDQNLGLLILFTLLFLLIGTALTAGAIWFVSYRVSRFPKARKIQENVLQSVTLPMVIDGGGLRLLQPLPAFESDQWQPIQVYNRRLISAGFNQIKAKSPGLRLGRIGFAELTDPSVVGWGMSGAGIEVDRKNYRPRLGLDLQQNFFVTIRPEDINAQSAADLSVQGQITFISSLNSFEANEDLVENARSSALDLIEDLIKNVADKGPGLIPGFSQTPDPFAQSNNFQTGNPYQQGNDPF